MPSPHAPVTSPVPSGPVTVTGHLIEGLRSTCRVLQTESVRYALVGPGTAALREGDRVTVTGVVRVDVKNPCGTTFVVSAVVR